MIGRWLLGLLFFVSFAASGAGAAVVGSKAFTEGYILGELTAETMAEAGPVRRRLGLGATGIALAALRAGEIDLYPEYTGTIEEALFHRSGVRSLPELRAALRPLGLTVSEPLGFANNYALAVPEAYARKHGVVTISDLKKVAGEIKTGFSHEFLSRADGLLPLCRRYDLKLPPVGALDHTLSYRGVANGAVELLDVYTTDAKIKTLGLRVLEDDLHFFTRYEAVLLARLSFTEQAPALWRKARTLEGSLSEAKMIKLNEAVDERGLSFRGAVEEYLGKESSDDGRWRENARRVWVRTGEHLELVALSLLAAVLLGIPGGILAVRYRGLGRGILAFSGLLQTIPSLALLCFLIPLFGIGVGSALVALFLYGLLPIVTGTYLGLLGIDQSLLEMSKVLGLSPWQSLVRIRLPLASRAVLSGVRTATVINIGTATLAALIGAGGYGAIILAGLATNDTGTILLGAVPAAGLALLVQGAFELAEHWLVPRGLR